MSDAHKTTSRLQLGDRVRVNENCKYQELIGDEGFIAGMIMRPDMTVDIWLSEVWPPRPGGSDGWSFSDSDKVSAP